MMTSLEIFFLVSMFFLFGVAIGFAVGLCIGAGPEEVEDDEES
jgi:hypothetical protein